MHGTWAGPAKGHIYVNILRHQKVIDRAEAAEAKLAKAVGVLSKINRGEYRINNVPDYVTEPEPTAQEIALAALAELERKP